MTSPDFLIASPPISRPADSRWLVQAWRGDPWAVVFSRFEAGAAIERFEARWRDGWWLAPIVPSVPHRLVGRAHRALKMADRGPAPATLTERLRSAQRHRRQLAGSRRPRLIGAGGR